MEVSLQMPDILYMRPPEGGAQGGTLAGLEQHDQDQKKTHDHMQADQENAQQVGRHS